MTQTITGAAMVIGGGIAGIQSALDLSGSGFKVYMVEKTPSIGGVMSQLDKTFPTNDCSMCIMSPKLVEVGRHPNIELITLAEVTAVRGDKGDFQVDIHQKPRYIDMAKCIACGECTKKCPKKVNDKYNAGLIKRKAIYVPYPQSVPLKYAIDGENCLYLTKGKCGNCAKECPAGAVNYEDKAKDFTLNVGAIILAPGFSAFNPKVMDNLSYGRHPDILTSLEFERMLSASGPTSGHLARISDHQEPKKIAWLQCVGSRDSNQCSNSYCSSVCCMYAIKQAIIAKEHAPYPLDCTIFFMDMRTHGKGFEACYNEAKHKHGIDFKRSRVHTVVPDSKTGELMLRYVSEGGALRDDAYDMVILSVGLEIPEELRDLAGKLAVDLMPSGFCRTQTFSPVSTSRAGIYVCGVFQGPKDIPQSVIEAGSAAMMAGADLFRSRHTLTKSVTKPLETDIRGESPRIGVFVCHCGINISGVVDVPAVRDYARTLPNVVYVEDNLYTCSQDTQDIMTRIIREHHLNRIIVAACSPKTHEPLFQETLINAGLNKYLLEFVNIRNQDSWVHRNNPAMATAKAKDLVRMAAAKASQLESLPEAQLDIDQRALVIGGGISGLSAAKALSRQGYHTTIIERSPVLGGQARKIHQTAQGEDVGAQLNDLIASVAADDTITIYNNAELTGVDGFVGNFTATVRQNHENITIRHGVAVIATGASEYQPDEYLYGKNPRVITGLELDERLKAKAPSLQDIKSAVFIQCVGSREPGRPYCSRICCTHSVLSALHLKEINPEMSVYVLYRDIRTYGERENLYKQARGKGVIFIRYDQDHKPDVRACNDPAKKDSIDVAVMDPILGRPLTLEADLLVLAAAIVPNKDEKLAQFFKVPINEDGFFVEAHVKLNPSSFATDGVFLCGLAHYPKPIDESIAQALAAASCAVTLLAKKTINTSGTVAEANVRDCSGCGTCVAVCPYGAPSMLTSGPFAGKAEINPVLCKGCGACVASCRSGALALKGFNDGQIMSMISAAGLK